MKNKLKCMVQIFGIAGILAIASCATFEPGWTTTEIKKSNVETEQLIANAHVLENSASSAEEVEMLIETFKEVVKSDPQHYYALWKIGNYHILMGAAYAEKKKEKKYHYKEAIKYCEKAMATNTTFKTEVLNGKKITEALDKLTIEQIDAMGYWYTARFYYFSECLAPLGRVMNTRIVIDNNKMIERIDEIDRQWAGGGNYFSRGLYYISIPERFGGSKERADQEFSEAIQIGPNYLVNRWGRAKYLYQLIGDQENFVTDLEWVVSQDPHEADNPYPWNVYFQEDAKKLLANYQ
jgi:tetratricopeptide (TPR) repeat protein